ncbi:MAG: O-antigen ligase family protein [Chloroflexi bacterium]|nr:O-antigen ligase family protein [Chloroflexota bacterium]
MNRLSRYCDGLIEASWLLAVIVAPLYFFVGLAQTFDLGKTIMFRITVLIGVAAWISKWISSGNFRFEKKSFSVLWARITGSPLVPLVGALAAVYIISSAFSISPLLSLRGSYERFDGLGTLGSYVLVFALVAFNLRRREQVDRLITTLAVVSFAVDFYAILQHFGFDSITWREFNVTDRALSTLGHPIFMAAFLGMTLMLLLGRVVFLVYSYRQSTARNVTMLVLAAFYLGVSVLNLLSIWYASSRGPIIALFLGLLFLGFSLLVYFKLRRVFYIFSAISVLLLVFTAVLNIPGGPLAGLRDRPFIGPLGHIFDTETGTGRTRVLIWNGMLRLVLPHEPIRFPNGDSVDQWNAIRPLIGYGPETISLIYENYYLPEMFSMESYDLIHDHAHNEFWDVLAFYGLLGFVVEYGLFLSLIYFGLKWLGWISSGLENKLYWSLSLLGGLLGGVIALVTLGAEYLGLGIPLGLLLGAVVILFMNMLHQDENPASSRDLWRDTIIISSLALIVFHYVEILFGIPVTSTRMLFWIVSAVMLIVGQDVTKELNKIPTETRIRQVGRHACIAISVIAALAPGFIGVAQKGFDTSTVLVNSLAANSYGTLWMFLGICLFACLVFELDVVVTSEYKNLLPNLILLFGIALFTSFLIWLVYAGQVAVISQTSFSDTSRVLVLHLRLIDLQFGVVFILAYICAFVFAEPDKTQILSWKPVPLITFGLVQISALVLSILVNLNPLQANGVARMFNKHVESGQYQSAFELDEALLELDPWQDVYLTGVADANMKYAIGLAGQQNVTGYLLIAEKYVKQSCQLNPLFFPNELEMARINRVWARLSQDSSTRSIRIAQAEQYYAYILEGKPYRVKLWVEWADFRAEFGDYQGAQEKFDEALQIDDTYAPLYLYSANMYMNQAEQQSDPVKRAELFNKALKDVKVGIEMLDRRGENPSLAFFQLGNIYTSLQQYEQARDAYLQADKFGAGDYQWEVYKNLADVSGRLNDISAQREYLQKAIAIAPAGEINALQSELNAINP